MKKTILIPVVLGLSACGGGGSGGGGGGGMGPPPVPAVAFSSSGFATAGETLPDGGNGNTFTVIGLSEADGLDQNGDGKIDGDDAELTIAFSDDGDTATVTVDGQSYVLTKEVTIDNLGANFPTGTFPKKFLIEDGTTSAEVSNITSRSYTETTSNGSVTFSYEEASLDYFGALDLVNDAHGNVFAFYGFTTDPAELETLGFATYSVLLAIEIDDGTTSATNYFVSGQGSISADFANGAVSGDFPIQAYRSIDENLQPPPLINVDVALDGDITGNTFSSELTLDQAIGHTASDITADGIFFGPDGAEIGGAITGTLESTAGGTKDVGGVLFGEKD